MWRLRARRSSPRRGGCGTTSALLRLGCVPQEYDCTAWPDWPGALPDGEVEPLSGLVVRRDVAEQDVVAGLERQRERLRHARLERLDLADHAREDGDVS